MASNSFGQIFRYTTFGESHGPEIGCVIDGVPPGIKLSEELLYLALNLHPLSFSEHWSSIPTL